MSVFSLFEIIDQAKNVGAYDIANLAFVVLADAALDNEKELHFIWEKARGNDDDYIYYDLLVITDSLRSACIPAPLLKQAMVFRSLCKEEIEKPEHNRAIDTSILKITDIEKELSRLIGQILDVNPNAQALANKYLAEKECQICSNYQNNTCSIHADYPLNLCQKWRISLKSEFKFIRTRAEKILFARVENTQKKRYVSMPKKGMNFRDIPWDSGDFTLSGSISNGRFSVTESKGNPQWTWYFVHQELQTIKNGESRWLIGKGCDHSSYYEVWTFKDPDLKAKRKVQSYPDLDSLWLPLVLDEYQTSDAYSYVSSEKITGKWGITRRFRLGM